MDSDDLVRYSALRRPVAVAALLLSLGIVLYVFNFDVFGIAACAVGLGGCSLYLVRHCAADDVRDNARNMEVAFRIGSVSAVCGVFFAAVMAVAESSWGHTSWVAMYAASVALYLAVLAANGWVLSGLRRVLAPAPAPGAPVALSPLDRSSASRAPATGPPAPWPAPAPAREPAPAAGMDEVPLGGRKGGAPGAGRAAGGEGAGGGAGDWAGGGAGDWAGEGAGDWAGEGAGGGPPPPADRPAGAPSDAEGEGAPMAPGAGSS